MSDPLPLAQALIRAPSVTPKDEGVMDVLQGALERLGFEARRYPFDEVDNLYARLGDKAASARHHRIMLGMASLDESFLQLVGRHPGLGLGWGLREALSVFFPLERCTWPLSCRNKRLPGRRLLF